MNWHYYNVEKPTLGQRVYFIRQFHWAGKTICEACEGIMRKDGIHKMDGGCIYSKGHVPDNDISVWVDRKEVFHDMV